MKYSTRSLQDQPNSGLFRFTLQLVLLTAMSLAFVLTAAGQDGNMPQSVQSRASAGQLTLEGSVLSSHHPGHPCAGHTGHPCTGHTGHPGYPCTGHTGHPGYPCHS